MQAKATKAAKKPKASEGFATLIIKKPGFFAKFKADALKKCKKAQKAAAKALREKFAPFMVLDNYGTFQLCWTYAEAASWLPYCAPDARILSKGGKVLARRIQEEAC